MLLLCRAEDIATVQSGGDDARITALIAMASEFIQFDYLNRDLEAATDIVEEVDGTGHNYLWVSRPPIRALTSVKKWDGTAFVALPGDVTLTTDYALEQSTPKKKRTIGKITTRDMAFGLGERMYQVTYNGGLWSSPSEVAGDIREAAVELVHFGVNLESRGGPEIESRTNPETGEVITFTSSMLKDATREKLDRWRIK